MAKALLSFEHVEMDCGKPETPKVYEDSTITDFINEESWLVFKLLKIEPTFLTKSNSEWDKTQSFKEFCSKVDGLTPINDVGERAVKMSGDFFGRLSEDEERRQALLQSIEGHKRRVPAARIFFMNKLSFGL